MARLKTYISVTFLITWTCWWVLVPLARAHTVAYGQPFFMLLYMLGGLGPTLAAYIAVLTTPAQSPLREFHSRLFRWRIDGRWYLIGLALPVALSLISVGVVIVVDPSFQRGLVVRPWYMFVPFFFVMIAGGGLEELGWRGIAQPEMERGLGRSAAAVSVGLIWALWHLPLFVLPGVGQYGTNFPVFAIRVVGGALILAWLYGRTRSILLCILFHASSNAIWALGLAIPYDRPRLAVLDACTRLAVGALLLAVGPMKSKRLQPTAPAAITARQS